LTGNLFHSIISPLIKKAKKLKSIILANVLDRPFYEFVLRLPKIANKFGLSWINLHNRHEHLIYNKRGPGVICDWEWSSFLSICEKYPKIAQRLAQVAFSEWPIGFSEKLRLSCKRETLVSFIIAYKGEERVAPLETVLRSILGQKNVNLECVIIDQSKESILKNRIFRDNDKVRYFHFPTKNHRFHKSWAFNRGARVANGDVLVFHDADVIIPVDYVNEILKRFDEDYEIARLTRFAFFLSEESTLQVLSNGLRPFQDYSNITFEFIRQNFQGLTIAIKKSTFFEVGGFDESFVFDALLKLHGGEDNEFFDRCLSRKIYAYSYLPIIHLFHSSHPGRWGGSENLSNLHLRRRLAMPREKRIMELIKREFGSLNGPCELDESTE